MLQKFAGRKIPSFYLGRKVFTNVFDGGSILPGSFIYQKEKRHSNRSRIPRWGGAKYTQQQKGSTRSSCRTSGGRSPSSEKSLWVQAPPRPLRSVIFYKLIDLPNCRQFKHKVRTPSPNLWAYHQD